MNEKSESDLKPTLGLSSTDERPPVDISKLPSLPPAGSKAWRGSGRSSGRLRTIGCGCSMLILIVAIFVAYQGLRRRVWSAYSEVQQGLQRSILSDVGQDEKQRLLTNLERFEADISSRKDPYPSIGRFVAAGRNVLADYVVDVEEVAALNVLIEDELSNAPGDRGER